MSWAEVAEAHAGLRDSPMNWCGVAESTILAFLTSFAAPGQPIAAKPKKSCEDADFWWAKTGTVLATMMQKAGYDQALQKQYLLFYRRYVVTSLGRQPTRTGKPRDWYSFMTDDFTPVEFSWSWSGSNSKPVVRYSIEPIDTSAEYPSDALEQTMAWRLINRIGQSQSTTDLSFFARLYQDLCICESEVAFSPFLKGHAAAKLPRSQTFLAFDLNKARTKAKAYFLPNLKAAQTRQPKLQLVRDSIGGLLDPQLPIAQAFQRFVDFVESQPRDQPLDVEIVSVDCVDPLASRMKIYVRSRQTSFNSVVRVLSLGGTLEAQEASVEDIRELWQLVLGLETDFSPLESLEPKSHRTAGVLYYFEFFPNNSFPRPKVYIPVKHYGKNDFEIARGLSIWLKRQGKTLMGGEYVQALQDVFPHRRLEKTRGIQTYISCNLGDTSSRTVTAYLNPKVYS